MSQLHGAIFDKRQCELGEGPFWHPQLKRLFWFDITQKKMLGRNGLVADEWRFDEMVSAAGWLSEQRLLIATESRLASFDISSQSIETIVPLEEKKPLNRSNDGATDRCGGFWIGTMGKSLEQGAGAIYRYYRGELRKLFGGITIPNAICFCPLGLHAYFCDTPEQIVYRLPIDGEGWPISEPEIFVDLRPTVLRPDGATVDGDGNLYCAFWGSGTVIQFGSDGLERERYLFNGVNTSCPVFGGEEMQSLFVTSAYEGLNESSSSDGVTFMMQTKSKGLVDEKVQLG